MTHFVLDKNPELDFEQNFSDFTRIIDSNPLNLIIHSDAFLKLNFINKIIQTSNLPVIYLDLDLLFSGYIASDTISKNPNVTLYQPNRTNLLETIKKIMVEISERKCMLVIDSLNSMFNFYHENKDAGRIVNSIIMLFGSVAKNSKSKVIVSGMARRKNNEEWVLSITGRHVIDSKKMNLIKLERQNTNFMANFLDEKAIPKQSFSFRIGSEMF